MTSRSEPVDLAGQRVLVTGGTTGIGRAVVHQLAALHARVITFGRHGDALHDSLVGTGGDITGLTADVAKAEDVARVFDAVDEQMGGLDVLVACAGLPSDPLEEMAEGDWRYVVETNLMGYMACARHALQRMEAQGSGHLLFVGSISSDIKAVGESVYSATKAGVDAFAQTLRKEIGDHHIRVSVVRPGTTGSDMAEPDPSEQRVAIEQECMLLAEDVAEAIVFVLTRPTRVDVVDLRIEPLIQATA